MASAAQPSCATCTCAGCMAMAWRMAWTPPPALPPPVLQPALPLPLPLHTARWQDSSPSARAESAPQPHCCTWLGVGWALGIWH